MRIGLTYDLKSDHRKTKESPNDAKAEFDRQVTINEVCEAIASGGYEVVKIGHARKLLSKCPKPGVDIVFNMCEGAGNRNRESEVPVILDFFKIPFVGSDGLTLGVTLDKAMAKKVFIADGVPTPKFFIADERTDLTNHTSMRFPFIVKPRHEGSSKGISEDSIVSDKKRLKGQVLEVNRIYKQSALVEEFISGSEFTVLVIGNDPACALAPVQIGILGKLDLGDLVYTSRRLKGTDVSYICPPKISKALEDKLRVLAVKAYQAVDCRDFGRVDFRVDKKGNPYVLEVNPLPSLSTEDVFPLVAKAEGWTFNGLIVKILEIALLRVGLKKEGRES
jgi:D-alanine-D-alanine ligase